MDCKGEAKMITAELKNSFLGIIKGNNDPLHIQKLYNYCYKIAEASLWAKLKMNPNEMSKFGTTPQQIAYDSISLLFINNVAGIMNLQQAYKNWEKKIVDESDIDFFLHSLVWKSLEQEIYNLQKESDPIFAKIHKTISIGISQNNYRKVHHFGTVYVISDSYSDIEGPVIPAEEFLLIPVQLFLYRQKKLLEGLIEYIQQNTEYFPAIPLNLLVRQIKEIYLRENFRADNYDEFRLIEIWDIILNVKDNIFDKINRSYVENGKLNKHEADKIVQIFNNISNDLVNGGMHLNLVDYFENVFCEVGKDEYYLKYQKILNYLFNIYRDEIQASLF